MSTTKANRAGGRSRRPTDAEYAKMVRERVADMHTLTSKLADRKLSPHEWADRFDAVLFRGHVDAYVLGRQRAGDFSSEGPEDRVLGLDAKDSQADFLQGFVDDIHNGRYTREDGTLDEDAVNARARMYAARFRGTANEAFVDASEADDEFDWELGPTEHCPDCLELHALGPYTRNTMLGHPGDGQTQCHSHCACRLRRRRDDVASFGRPDIYIGGENGDQPDESQAIRAVSDVVKIPLAGSGAGMLRKARGSVSKVLAVDMPDVSAVVVDLRGQPLETGGIGDLDGRYNRRTRTIEIAKHGDDQQLGFAHEFSHAMYQDVVKPAEGRVGKQLTAPLFEAIDASDSIQIIRALTRMDQITAAEAAYWLDPEELFCRAMAQFVAQESGNPAMLRSVEKMSKIVGAEVGLPTQWDTDDFRQIAIEIRRLTVKLNIRKKWLLTLSDAEPKRWESTPIPCLN